MYLSFVGEFIFNDSQYNLSSALTSFISQAIIGETVTTIQKEGQPFLELSAEEAENLANKRLTIPSGSRAIDTLTEGGYRTGEIVEVFGESKTGKTQLAMQAALSAAMDGLGAVFVDTEGTFRPERVERMAEVRGQDPRKILSRVYAIRAETTTTQIEAIAKMRDDSRVAQSKLLVVDTVSKNFSVEFGGEKRLKVRQSLLGLYANKLARDAVLHDRAVLLTNRVALGMAYGGPKVIALGGQSLRRFVSRSIQLTRHGTEVSATLLSRDGPARTLRSSVTEMGFE